MKNRTTQLMTVCALALACSTAWAQNDPTFLLQIVDVNGSPHTGDPASLVAAPGDIVTLELRLRDYSPNGIGLKGFQASMGYDSYFNGVAGNVLPVDFATTTDVNGFCSAGSGVVGVHNTTNAFLDSTHPEFVFSGLTIFPSVASNTCNYWYTAAVFMSSGPIAPQDGTHYYVGTLILEVSADAAGTFVVDYDMTDVSPPTGPDNCFITQDDDLNIFDLEFEQVTITVPWGACCVETPTESCERTNELSCSGTWMEDIDCPGPDECPCMSASDCDDGNYCTSDACDDHACAYTLTYNETTHCCNPNTGATVLISDGKPCTIDECNPLTGVVTHTVDTGFCLIDDICRTETEINSANDCEACDPSQDVYDWSFRDAGSLCDDGQPCTGTGAPGIGYDECDGAGACAGVDDPDCHDICTEAFDAFDGANYGNNASAGPDFVEASCQPNSNHDVWWHYTAMCHGQITMDTEGSVLIPTNNPVLSVYDACGGSEIACNDNSSGMQASVTFTTTAGGEYWIRVAGYAANTGDIVLNIDPVNDCMIGDTCYAEGFVNPGNDCEACIPATSTTDWSPREIGTACGSQADTDCNNPNTCDGAGVCLDNYEPIDTPCGDPGDTECDNPDTCNATGVCLPNHEPAETACGDPTETDCDNADSCDGSGSCVENLEPNGTACTTDDIECTQDVCQAGVCEHPFYSAGYPCGDPMETDCDHADTCDGAGVCLLNQEEDGTVCDDHDPSTGLSFCEDAICVGQTTVLPPLVRARGSRALEIIPQPEDDTSQVAIRVTSPDLPCVEVYVNAAHELEVPDPVDGPLFQTAAEWGTVIAIGLDIVPDTEYEVVIELADAELPPVPAETAIFTDTNHNDTVNLTDIICVLDMFGTNPAEQPECGVPEADTLGAGMDDCFPNRFVNLTDIIAVLSAFDHWPYPCDYPCTP